MANIVANNLDLTASAKYSYLTQNYLSGRTTFVIENCEEFRPNDFVLLGEFGSSTTEIRQIESIALSTNTLTLDEATLFPHAESTKVYILNYDMVRFFHTATTNFSISDPVYETVYLGGDTTQFDITNPSGTTFRYTYDGTGINPYISKFIKTGYTVVLSAQNFNVSNQGTFVVSGVSTNYFDIVNPSGVEESNKTIGNGSLSVSTNYLALDTSNLTTKIRDITNTTGYGWFTFYNSYLAVASQNSNAIPYAGFAENSVRSLIDRFFSSLNNKEQKLITYEEAFAWLNEAYSIAKNELNLVNKEYTSSDAYSLSIVSGTAEYSLPDDFSDLLSVTTNDGSMIGKIEIGEIENYIGSNPTDVKYYLRNGYIGFAPTPTSTATYKIRYTQKSDKLDSVYDTIDLPDNNFYCLMDYMMFRAASKLNRTDGLQNRELFYNAVERMKNISISRDNNTNDAWGISQSSNI